MESISLQCPVTIKVKVTEKFRAKMLDKMEKQLAEVDLKLSKIDIQKKKFLEEHAEDNIQQVGAIVQKMEVDKAKGLKLFHRSDILAYLLNNAKGIAVAGAHGKTTTSSMISVVLEHAKVDPTILIGGFVDYLKGNAKLGKSDYLVAEADESDGSFLKFYPKIAVVTNIEDDHMDHYGSMENIIKAFIQFVQNLDKETGLAVLCFDNENIRNIADKVDRKYISYALDHDADYMAKDIKIDGPHTSFTVIYKGEVLGDVALNIPGKHNVLNALATIAVCHHMGLSIEEIAEGFKVFSGTKRRFQTKFRNENVWIVDDYAHHPTAIRYVIEATRVRYPGKKIVAIFQPDRFSRGARFAKEFAQEMDKADYPYFCPFPENAKHEDGIDIDIYDISKNSARAKVITEDEAGVKELMQYDNCVFLFMSSKDIYKFEEMLIEAKKSI